jgi:hypothetical protein
MSTATQPRRKYQFADRATAEDAYRKESALKTRAQRMLTASVHGSPLHTLTSGNYRLIIQTHNYNGKLLCDAGLMVIETTDTSVFTSEVHSAHDWCEQWRNYPCHHDDQYTLRDLADKAREILRTAEKSL